MRRHINTASIIILIMLPAAAHIVYAGWADNGVPVVTATEWQSHPQLAVAGNGGAIIAWKDGRSGTDNDIYAQRIDGVGTTQWDDDGIPVCTAEENQSDIRIVPDGSEGAIICWSDLRTGNYTIDIYAQRIGGDGTRLWPSGGTTICAAANNQIDHQMISDGSDGAIICWADYRDFTWDIYAQKVRGGTILWKSDGTAVCDESEFQMNPDLTSDGAGGAIIVWSDLRSASDYDIYAQRIDKDGSPLWMSGGVIVCAMGYSHETYPRIVPDGAGGAIVTWVDDRSGGRDIYAQRINASGTTLWSTNGIPVCTANNYQYDQWMIPDDPNGAIIVWFDMRSGMGDIYAQKINGSGVLQWTANGIPVCVATSTQGDARVASDGNGGAIFSWRDLRSAYSNYDVYAQRVDESGNALWATDGISICLDDSTQANPEIVSDGYGGAIIAWADNRTGNMDIYAQLVDPDGYWGDRLPPVIYAVRDVPDDQGGFVYLSWYSSRLDLYRDDIMSHYTIWRAIDPIEAAEAIGFGAEFIDSPEWFTETQTENVIRAEFVAGSTYFWELIGSQDAYFFEAYGMTIPTLFDSIDTSSEYHYFQVIAHTTDPRTFYSSPPDSCRSVDNLSPCPPLALAGEQSYQPAGLELSWSPNSEADLGGYNIYRGTDPTFEPGPGNLLSTGCDTLAFDGSWTWDAGFCYKVAAVDVHGNESDYATLCIEQVTGDDPMPLPDATFLAQNYPNPFNPNTTIAFGLKAGGFVNLSVYDAAGRLVATLINESRPAGEYAATWNGNTENGSQAASGVYFYKLVTEEFAKTRKMILLR